MKNLLSIIVVSTSLFCITACGGLNTVVEVPMPEHTPQLVVTSLFSSNNVMPFEVSESRGLLSNTELKPLKSAKIELYENNVLKALVHFNDSANMYISSFQPQPGSQYMINVTDTLTGRVATASTVVPKQISIVTVSDVKRTAKEQTTLTVELKDPQPGIRNYFRISISDFFHSGSSSFTSSDPELTDLQPSSGIGNDDAEKNYYGWAYFTDELFDGKSKKILLKTHANFEDRQSSIVVQNISEPYFRYISTSTIQSYNGDSPFANPTKVYGNISNGFGIFAGASSTRIFVTY